MATALAECEPIYPAASSEAECLAWARRASRGIERFAYRQLSCAVTSDDARAAEYLLQQVIGLRRKLDNWKLGR